ncbi:MAG TPA: hypothetical protein VHC49_03130 [Mycobacteriales bacterium]|nr:hypothetical protein [Mycobacteriales bacterium]
MNEAQRKAYREFIRTHHPDIGGDPEVFAAGLAELRNAAPISGTFAERWPDWVAPDDRRLKTDIVFRRRPHGLAAVIAWLKERTGRNTRPPRVH